MSKRLQHFLHCCFLLIFIASLALVQPSLAASPAAAPHPQADKPRQDEIRYGHNSRTGRLSFVGSDRSAPLIKIGAVGAQSVEAAGMTVIRRYADQFGIQDPTRSLRLDRVQRAADGTTLRYQQQYRGVPVVGGDMVVNTDEAGNVISLNGKVSPDLALPSVTPAISAEQARQIALAGLQEWHGISPDSAESTEPELWIYDERIFHESTKPVALVWRMELSPHDFTRPVREFVLVDAHTGEIVLHFNQVDTSWNFQEEEPTAEPTPPPFETPTPEPTPTEMPTPESTPTEIATAEPVSADQSNENQHGFTLAGGSIALTEGNYQEAYILSAFTKTMSVLVKDESLNPVSGIEVQFDAPASGASATFPDGSHQYTVTTDANGIATSAVLTANAAMGSYDVIATVAGTNLQAVFVLTNMGPVKFVDAENGSDALSFGRKCGEIAYPCNTINAGIQKAKAGDLIKVSAGYYTQPVSVSKDLSLSGGWNSTFELQNGDSSIGVNSSQISISVNSGISASIDRINIKGGMRGIKNEGNLQYQYSYITRTRQAILNWGNLSILNVTISRNTCHGGCDRTPGILNDGGNISLTNMTIVDNYLYNVLFGSNPPPPPQSGGIFNKAGTVTLKNTIVAQNHTNVGYDCYGSLTSSGNNIIGVNENCSFTPASGDFVGTRQKPFYSGYLPLSDNGGNTLTVPLTPLSPAVNAGDSASCPAADQRGTARAVGTACSIGAFEGTQEGKPVGYAITYAASLGGYLPGHNFKCETPTTNCTNGVEPEIDYLHTLGLDIFDFFLTHHNRNSLDDAGKPILSSANYPEQNAFWTGSQMAFGKGLVVDDVVAHEFTHGITQYTSNLFYYYQSGAINESLSDLWGEYYDQTNSFGKDTNAVRWLIGEDLPASIGVVRNMKNPRAFYDPDKMTSPYYYLGPNDNGGVHWNSGVNNKAVFLMVDGGTFNNRTVRGIGWKKTAAIYYYVQTRLLTSASDYADLYYALNHACSALAGGVEGITEDDCKQVETAANAVEMTVYPISGFNPDVNHCPDGLVKDPTDLFLDDFENGSSKWSFTAAVGALDWSIIPGKYNKTYATSGDHALHGANADDSNTGLVSDTRAEMAVGVVIPTGTVTMLHFNHSFGFHYDYHVGDDIWTFLDGGVLEYTTDNGSTWKDAWGLFSDGLNYIGYIANFTGYNSNPLRNRAAFVFDSHGYVSSRYNLSSLAGKTVRFRWRMGTDGIEPPLGWFIDDVRIYTCVGAPGTPVLSTPANGSLVTNYQPKLDWKDAANAVRYELQVATDTGFTKLIFSASDLAISEYRFTSSLAANTRHYWRVRSYNGIDAASPWSPTWSFRTALLPPVIEAPADGSTPGSLRPTFRWTASPGAASYRVVISTSPNFSTPLVDITDTVTSYTPATNLPANVPVYWRVRAYGSNPSAWASSSFNSPNPPNNPGLSSPANNAIVYNYTPTLKWNPASIPTGAPALASYHLQFDDDADFSSPLYDQPGLTERTFTVPNSISANQKFYWRVKAVNVDGQYSTWSSRSLRTAIVPPALLSPASDFVTNSLRPVFEWSSSPGATSYTLVVSTLADFTTPLINITQTATNYTPTVDLPTGAMLYWRVRANGTNPSAWTASSFMIPVPPTKPGLASPAGNALVRHDAITLKWNASVIAAGAPALACYQVQFDDTADFSSLLYQAETTERTFTIPDALPTNQKFYWRVRAVNILGQYSSWSSRALRTRIIPPIIAAPAAGSIQDSLRPTFTWAPSPYATSYTLMISTFSDFSSPLVNVTINTTSYLPSANLPPGTVIYWRVKANGTNPSLWSTSSFTTPNPPNNPALSSPANNARVNTYMPTLKWKASVIPTGAPALAYYHIQVDNDADFSSPLYDQTDLLDRFFTIPEPLPDNQKFHWRVRAVNTEGHYAAWSKRSFNTRIFAPVIEEPAPAPSITESLRPTLRWSTAPHAVSYTLVISSFPNFSLPLVTITTPDTSYTPTFNLPSAALLHWRVMANGTNPSLWTASSFITPDPPSTPTLVSPVGNKITYSYTPTLKWKPATTLAGAPAFDSYHLQIDNDADYSSPLYNETVLPYPVLPFQKICPKINAIFGVSERLTLRGSLAGGHHLPSGP
jgi:Zn-dependent metalloprotease